MLPQEVQNSVYDFWYIAKKDIFKSWMYESDPANLQPKIRKINRDVADFIRSLMPASQQKSAWFLLNQQTRAVTIPVEFLQILQYHRLD